MSGSILISLFFGVQLILAFFYLVNFKKRQQKEREVCYLRVKHLLRDPDIVKVALWINIDKVNGVPYKSDAEYYTNLRNGLMNIGRVSVALFQPGEYQLTVSSNSRDEYQGVEMNVTLFPGQVYQLGCNDSGPYFVLDPRPERYEYKA